CQHAPHPPPASLTSRGSSLGGPAPSRGPAPSHPTPGGRGRTTRRRTWGRRATRGGGGHRGRVAVVLAFCLGLCWSSVLDRLDLVSWTIAVVACAGHGVAVVPPCLGSFPRARRASRCRSAAGGAGLPQRRVRPTCGQIFAQRICSIGIWWATAKVAPPEV